MKYLYNIHPGEVWWCAADLGWVLILLSHRKDKLISYFSKVVGHSYGCYGPLLNGLTTVIYEGKPVGTPDASSFFRIIHDHKVISSFWSPTALRIIRQNDPENKHATKYNMDHFQSLTLAGEVCDKDTLLWARKIFNETLVINHYGQTETGSAISTVCLGFETHPVR
jgi:propionyl-CoA synthetase